MWATCCFFRNDRAFSTLSVSKSVRITMLIVPEFDFVNSSNTLSAKLVKPFVTPELINSVHKPQMLLVTACLEASKWLLTKTSRNSSIFICEFIVRNSGNVMILLITLIHKESNAVSEGVLLATFTWLFVEKLETKNVTPPFH